MYDIVVGRSSGDLLKYGLKGTILLAKHYIQMGQTVSLSNNVYMDITRSHVVFVCGKRGGGKCLTGDALISLSDGSRVPISDLVHDKKIVSLDSDLKIKECLKEGFYRRFVDRLLKITLRTGKTIKLTPEHPLLTINGWVPAQELTLNSRIATPRALPFFGDSVLTEIDAKLLAYFIAEGHLGNGFVLFSNSDPTIVNDFNCAISSYDNTLVVNSHGMYNFRVVQNLPHARDIVSRDKLGRIIYSVPLDRKSSIRKYLENFGLYGKKSYEKFIPEVLFSCNEKTISVFLNRLFSCDGTIYKETSGECFRYRISYCSNSRKIIDSVQSLLLKFGIVSKIRLKKTACKDAFELEIYQEFLHTFLQKIGFFGKKEILAKEAIRHCLVVKRNTNVDTIPKEIWDSFKPERWTEIGKCLNYSHPKAVRESIRYSPSRQKLMSIAVACQDQYLATLADSDIFWDEIVAIEEICGETEVFDITVPDTHNFIANDIIVHNSYTLGVIAEGLSSVPKEVANNLSIVLVDTMGIYWTMKYPNHKEADLLKDWGIEPTGLDVKIYTPEQYYYKYKQQGIPTDVPFTIATNELSGSDWCMAFGFSENDQYGVLIDKVIGLLQDKLETTGERYDIDEILQEIDNEKDIEVYVRAAVRNHFVNAKTWGLFSKDGTKLHDLVTGGQVTILDVSCYATMPNGWNIKSLVLGLLGQKLFTQRMLARKDEEFADINRKVHLFGNDNDTAQKEPLVWLVVDEAHEFLPKDGTTAASSALITILREGRQPGISLILATQQPGKIHTDVMTQSDIFLSHRITAKIDVDALSMLMQSYMRKGLDVELDNLPRVKGAGVIFDDTNEKMFPVRIRPRMTWHGGESPSAIPDTKKLGDF